MGNPLFVADSCMFGTRSVAIIPENSPIVLLLKPPENQSDSNDSTRSIQDRLYEQAPRRSSK